MGTNDSSNTDSGRSSHVGSLVILLAVYAALYLSIAGAIHFVTSPEAVAAVVTKATGAQNAIPVPAEPAAGGSGASANELVDPEGPDNSRECVDGVDVSCIYD